MIANALTYSMMAISAPNVTKALHLTEEEAESFDPQDIFDTIQVKNPVTGSIETTPSSYCTHHIKAQSKLSAVVHDTIRDDLFGGGVPLDFAARLLSASDPTASAFLLSRLSRADQQIPDGEFQTIIAIRYGLGFNHLINLQPSNTCVLCKGPCDQKYMHLVRCNAGNGNQRRHDNITHEIVRLHTICGKRSKLEQMTFPDSQKRLDIVVDEEDHQVRIDTTIVDPTGEAVVKQASHTPLAALQHAIKEKRKKYQSIIDNLPIPGSMQLVVAGFEATGAWSDEFKKYFTALTKQAQQQNSDLQQTFALEWTIKLSVKIHREIAKSILYKTRNFFKGNFDIYEFIIYDKCFDFTSPLNQELPITIASARKETLKTKKKNFSNNNSGRSNSIRSSLTS